MKVMGIFLLWISCLCFALGNTYGYRTPSKEKLLESIHKRVHDLNERMKRMGFSDLPEVEGLKEPSIYLTPTNSVQELETPSAVEGAKNKFEKKSVTSISPAEPNIGFYILPFAGFALSKDLEWESPSGEVAAIEHEMGYTLGLRLGYRWKNFYLEERFSYMSFSFDKIDNGSGEYSISGESKNLSFHQCLGFNFNFNDWSGIQFGASAGITQRDLSILNISGSPSIQDYETDWVFSYDGIIGIFFQPGGYFRGGINYRWLMAESLKNFSTTEMHLIEVSLGLQF